MILRNKKISESILGIKRSEETKQKLSKIASQRVGEKNSFYGRQHSAETKNKIGFDNKGYSKKTNPESTDNKQIPNKGKYHLFN